MSRITICDIPIDGFTMHETIDKIDNAIAQGKTIHHVVVNAAKIVNARKDHQLRNSITNCDIINADGQSIVWAARLLNKHLPERVAGIDLMEAIIELGAKKKYRIFFFGAREEVLNRVVNIYINKYGKDIIAGYRNGYYKEDEETVIAQQIADSGADILLVAMNSPKKELFINTYKHLIRASFIMGVGGSFDVISGLVKRAPVWMQKCGLEWFFRVVQEPRRMWKRYLIGNTVFIYLIFKEKIKQSFRLK